MCRLERKGREDPGRVKKGVVQIRLWAIVRIVDKLSGERHGSAPSSSDPCTGRERNNAHCGSEISKARMGSKNARFFKSDENQRIRKKVGAFATGEQGGEVGSTVNCVGGQN